MRGERQRELILLRQVERERLNIDWFASPSYVAEIDEEFVRVEVLAGE